MERFITANSCALRVSDSGYEQCGQGGKCLVLVHGYLESLDVWEWILPYLLPKFRVVSMDLPGHGISQVMSPTHTMEFLADTVAGVFNVLGIERATLVGHSMGGYVGFEFLRKYPQKLDKFIALHSIPNTYTAEKRERRQRELEMIESGKKDLLGRMSFEIRFAEWNREEFADVIEAMEEDVTVMEEQGITAILRGMMDRRDCNDVVKQTQVPVLFVLGRGDDLIPQEIALKVIESQPQAKFVWLERSGHEGMIEQPELCARVIEDFVNEN